LGWLADRMDHRGIFALVSVDEEYREK